MASHDHGIHSCEECVPKGSDYFQLNMGRRRRSSSHKKRRRKMGANWISSSHHSKKIPQAMRNMKNSSLDKPLINIIIWIRNDDFMNEEDDKAKWSRWSLPMKQIKYKYSIVISWYCFVIHLIIFNWCVMHDRLFALMTIYY